MNEHDPLTIDEAEACIEGLQKYKNPDLLEWYDCKNNP